MIDDYTANLRATAEALRTQAQQHTAYAAQCIRMAEQYEEALLVSDTTGD